MTVFEAITNNESTTVDQSLEAEEKEDSIQGTD